MSEVTRYDHPESDSVVYRIRIQRTDLIGDGIVLKLLKLLVATLELVAMDRKMLMPPKRELEP